MVNPAYRPVSKMAPDLRTRILTEATKLFAQHGYNGTSMRAVALGVGCTKPALYYHFNNKEDLYCAAIEAVERFHIDMLEAMLAEDTPIRTRLGRGFDAFLHSVRTQPHEMQLLLMAQHDPEVASFAKLNLHAMHHTQFSHIEALLTEGIRRGEIRENVSIPELCVSLMGLANIWAIRCLQGDPVPDNISSHILDLFFQGVCPS